MYPPVNWHSNQNLPFPIGTTSTTGLFSIALLVPPQRKYIKNTYVICTLHTLCICTKSEERRDLPSPSNNSTIYPNEGNQFRATPSRQLMSAHAPPQLRIVAKGCERWRRILFGAPASLGFFMDFSPSIFDLTPASCDTVWTKKTSSEGKGVWRKWAKSWNNQLIESEKIWTLREHAWGRKPLHQVDILEPVCQIQVYTSCTTFSTV